MRVPILPFLLCVGLAALAGCRAHGDPRVAIPTQTVPAPGSATRTVIVLPGRSDRLRDLQRTGVAEAIQRAWPDAEVVLTGLALDYYRAGNAERRLHEEIVAPARQRGTREVWLAGASLGGMGAILYDRTHPGVVTGLVLLAPYLGETRLHDEIRAAGGLRAWQPGPDTGVTPETWQRELWRRVRDWQADPQAAPAVWLSYGRDDYLRPAMPLLEAALPPNRVIVVDGGHTWRVWTPALEDVLSRIDADRGGPPRAGDSP